MAMSRELLLQAYRNMRNIREFEETIHRENTTGEIPGFLQQADQHCKPVG